MEIYMEQDAPLLLQRAHCVREHLNALRRVLHLLRDQHPKLNQLANHSY